jgi:predicted transcriptional regulator
MNKQLSKGDALHALHNYAEVVNNIPQLIKSSGYRVEYIADKLQIPRSTFYSKRRDKSFTFNDLLKIVTFINDDEDSIEESNYLRLLAQARMQETGTVTREQVMDALDA